MADLPQASIASLLYIIYPFIATYAAHITIVRNHNKFPHITSQTQPLATELKIAFLLVLST